MGIPHPDFLLSQLSASQFNEWIDYSAIEPFGEYRQELRHGTLAALIHNVNYTEKVKAIDYMHFMDSLEEKPMTPEETQQQIDKEVFGL